MPTILEMQALKRAGKTITLGLPDGRQISLGVFLKAWHKLADLRASGQMDEAQIYNGWSLFGATGPEILRDITAGVLDRINLRGGVVLRELNRLRVRRQLNRRVRKGFLACDCRWCGQPLHRYEHKENRFCSKDCRRDYYS